MKKMKFYKLFLLLIILIIAICIHTYSFANISISQSNVNIVKEESISLTLTTAQNMTGTITVTSKNPDIATGKSNLNWIEDENNNVTIKINGNNVGTTIVYVTATLSDKAGNEESYTKEVNVTVNPKVETSQEPTTPSEPSTPTEPTTPATPTVKEKSKVATLSNLGIRPNDFSGFRANTASYNVEVPYETEEIEVYANAAKGEENKQKISGTGKKKLEVGKNKIEVTVVAEDEITRKTYTINVTRKEKEDKKDEEKPEEEPIENVEEVFGLSELNIEKLKLTPQFKTDIYEYKVNLKDDLEELKIETVATESNATIEILGNEELKDGENVITINVKSEDKEKNATYQITVNKVSTKLEEELEMQKIEQAKVKRQQMVRKSIISGAIIIVVAIIIVLVVILIKRNQPYDNDGEFVEFPEYNKENEDDYVEVDESELYDDDFDNKKQKGKRFR